MKTKLFSGAVIRTAALAALLALLFCACAPADLPDDGQVRDFTPPVRPATFYRDMSVIDFTGVGYTPWDAQPPEAQPTVDYTLMIYMIGSDLESLDGAATDDIAEMLGSGVDTQHVNVLLLTGGTNVWRNDIIPENSCVIWRVQDGSLRQIADLGLLNMGDAGTLSSFIRYGLQHFPAQRYGLIFWDHAGGSIAGYGHDEKFDSSLTLLEMNYAFEQAGLRGQKLEFIGFDACLMATVEMAVIAAPYARYLIASQDLEPGDGWDYAFLGELSAAVDGEAAGRMIADTFIDFYGRRFRQPLTLSVVDLSRAGEVMAAMDALMAAGSRDLASDGAHTFGALSKRRGRTKTFGGGSPRDAQCDMVDIADMARALHDLYPYQARNLLEALERAVVYNRHNSRTDLGGLSTYYIFSGKEMAAQSVEIYASLGMGSAYTAFLRDFASMMSAPPAATRSRTSAGTSGQYLCMHLTKWRALDDAPGYYANTGIRNLGDTAENLWPSIGGEFVCLYPLDQESGRALYAVPGRHNGREVNFIVLRCDLHPMGRVLGARQREGALIQKGYDDIEPGDEIAFYQAVRSFDSGDSSLSWRATPPQMVGGTLSVKWIRPPAQGYYYSLLTTDLHHDEHYAPLKKTPPIMGSGSGIAVECQAS